MLPYALKLYPNYTPNKSNSKKQTNKKNHTCNISQCSHSTQELTILSKTKRSDILFNARCSGEEKMLVSSLCLKEGKPTSFKDRGFGVLSGTQNKCTACHWEQALYSNVMSYTHAHAHAHMHTHEHAHACVHTHRNTHVHAHTHICTHMQTHARAHVNTHT